LGLGLRLGALLDGFRLGGHPSVGGVGKKCVGRTGADAGGAATAVYVVGSIDDNLLVVAVENAEGHMDGG